MLKNITSNLEGQSQLSTRSIINVLPICSIKDPEVDISPFEYLGH